MVAASAAAILYQAPEVRSGGVHPVVAVGVVAGLLAPVVILLTDRLTRPVTAWLDDGVGDPGEVLRRVVEHPRLHARIVAGTWLVGVVAVSVIRAASVPAGRAETVAGTLLTGLAAGILVAAIAYLADEAALRPVLPRVLGPEGPGEAAVPPLSGRVRARLAVMWLLGGLGPLLAVGLAVHDRLNRPGGVGSLESLVWVLVGLGAAAGAYLAASVRATVAEPLEHIRRAADAVRRGDLGVEVPVTSVDEVGSAAAAVNAMVAALRDRQRLADLFGRHVGEEVARRALANGVALGGERRVISTLFVDLEGFTALAERSRPEDVVALLNRVFGAVVRAVDAHGGLVNKFVGDAALAVFGAPVDDDDHAVAAIAAAADLADALGALGVRFGIGVATGEVVAGNVGAETRLEYTVIGDAVNTAERLQHLARRVAGPTGGGILVADATVAAAGALPDGLACRLRHHGPVTLRGRARPVDVWVLTGDAGAPGPPGAPGAPTDSVADPASHP